jgi:hypothetical protein
MLADPIGIYQLLDAVTRSVSVDDTLSNNDLRGLGFEMRSFRSSRVQFVIAPVSRIGRQGAHSVSLLEDARAAELWMRCTTMPWAPTSSGTPRTRLGNCRAERSVGPAAAQHRVQRLPQDAQVERHRPVLDVAQVEPDHFLPGQGAGEPAEVQRRPANYTRARS